MSHVSYFHLQIYKSKFKILFFKIIHNLLYFSVCRNLDRHDRRWIYPTWMKDKSYLDCMNVCCHSLGYLIAYIYVSFDFIYGFCIFLSLTFCFHLYFSYWTKILNHNIVWISLVFLMSFIFSAWFTLQIQQ